MTAGGTPPPDRAVRPPRKPSTARSRGEAVLRTTDALIAADWEWHDYPQPAKRRILALRKALQDLLRATA